jgi:hypothetical protein
MYEGILMMFNTFRAESLPHHIQNELFKFEGDQFKTKISCTWCICLGKSRPNAPCAILLVCHAYLGKSRPSAAHAIYILLCKSPGFNIHTKSTAKAVRHYDEIACYQ